MSMAQWISITLMVIAVNVLWQIGGQFWKLARRIGVPAASCAYAYFYNKKKRQRWGCLLMLALIGLLSAGYGENSKLKKWLGGSEWLTRLAMSCLISSVFASYSIIEHHVTWRIALTYCVNILAWQVRAGRLCGIGKYDILIEDIFRATACAISVAIA